jgi:Zn-dependent protease with chaperone function
MFLLARKVNLVFRKYFLEADRLAAEVVGKTQMLQTLGKIDSMRLADVEERKKEKLTVWKREGVFPWPSLTERIQNLETVPSQP